jgi:hydrocephalus-inducing protein
VLKPTQETSIEIVFNSHEQEKFAKQLQLEVEDTEGLGVKQTPVVIDVLAEAFDISVQLLNFKSPENNLLDFGDVKVGAIAQQSFSIKNAGLYMVKFEFDMKKKLFRDNFTIEPQNGSIEPGQERQINVIFQSQSEIKLRTSGYKSDIVLEIKEGRTQETFNKVYINVNVNAVYSKYSIAPVKNINFGPLQFNETKVRHYEIKNDGLFEFNYCIFDYADEEKRRQLSDEREEAKQAEQEGANAGTGKDGKPAKGKDKPKAPAKKDAKKGTDPMALGVSQFVISPAYGAIPPESSIQIEVKFNAQGAKLYEQKIAIDVTNRDPDDQPQGILYELMGESCIPGINNENFDAIFEEQIVVPT